MYNVYVCACMSVGPTRTIASPTARFKFDSRDLEPISYNKIIIIIFFLFYYAAKISIVRKEYMKMINKVQQNQSAAVGLQKDLLLSRWFTLLSGEAGPESSNILKSPG